jgi:SsrA-binding protein
VPKETDDTRQIAGNRKAFHDFFVEDRFEAGIVLVGTEVKSLREGRVNLRDSYAEVRGGEVFLMGVHISPYEMGNSANHDPLRPRKLLLHANEIGRLEQKINEKGYTLVPTRMYFRGSRVKVEIGLARGKKQYDKRADMAARDAARDVQRALRQRDDDR